MARNSVESTVKLVDETQVRYDGELVSVTDHVVTFKAKKRGGRRFIQQSFPLSRVLAYGQDFIVVKQQSLVNSRVFRPLTGNVDNSKNGFYVVDGVYINSAFATVEADLGVLEESAPRAKPRAGAAPARRKRPA